MVKIAPFRGVVYKKSAFEEAGGLLLAPPYDVVSRAQRQAVLDSHPYNFMHLDLGPVMPGDADHMSWHDRSASTLIAWMNSGVLVRREQPSVVMMDTDWVHPVTGRRMTRHGMLCLIKLEPPSREARIKPHEKTFSFHKEERLDLMEKTRCQLSPVFGFFPDPEDKIIRKMYDLAGDPDLTVAEPSGLSHQISFLQANSHLAELVGALADSTVYLADGHHRYETALNYRARVLAELARNGQEPAPNSALDYVLIYLCSMADQGLCVLPTHRVLRKIDLSDEEILAALEPFAQIKTFPWSKEDGDASALAGLARKLRRDDSKGLTVYGLSLKGSDKYYFLKIRELVKHKLARARPEEAALASLDVSILNVVFKEALGLTEADLDDPVCIDYFSETAAALEAVRNNGDRAAFILNHTSLVEILKVTEEGLCMPRKSTYFYPKVSSGVVFNLVNPMESVPEISNP
ncbi:MAG: DUF1015 domain-containing protein [Deltaproteobacteria bacterium]|jgi:uncharacterized protein (DUF1015 family)|nr:DUF1015 domain-containing protein [Deltaproteobacteria bacterium]